MSYRDITPSSYRRRFAECVKVSVGIDPRRERSQCVISISTGIAERASLAYGMRVQFLLGEDVDRGKLKMRAVFDEERRHYARKLIWHSRTHQSLRTTVEAWDGCPRTLSATVCQYEIGDGELLIRLPAAFSEQRQPARRLEVA